MKSMASTRQSYQVREMFASIASKYDLGNTVLSGGVHHIWKRALFRCVDNLSLPSDSAVIDLCTGTGDLLPALEKRFDLVVGADFCAPMLKQALIKSPNSKRSLLQADGLCLPMQANQFDLVTVAFGVRNFEDLSQGLSEIKRVLKPGGHLVILEFGQPSLPLFAPIYRWYSRYIMPVVGGFVTGNRSAYKYLPETAKVFPCGRNFESALMKVGFCIENTNALTGGIAYLYCARKSDHKEN